MPLDLLSLTAGAASGALVAGAIAYAAAAARRGEPGTAVTGVWSLSEVGPQACVVAERLALTQLPPGARVIVRPGSPVPVDLLQAAQVRMHPGVRGNLAVGDREALLFLGAAAPRTLAVHTRDAGLVARARSEFQRLWAEATPYLLPVHVWDLATHVGHDVEVTGAVMAAWPSEGTAVLTLSEGGHTVTVVSPDPRDAALKGASVRIEGRVRESDGLPLVAAHRVERARAARPAQPGDR